MITVRNYDGEYIMLNEAWIAHIRFRTKYTILTMHDGEEIRVLDTEASLKAKLTAAYRYGVGT